MAAGEDRQPRRETAEVIVGHQCCAIDDRSKALAQRQEHALPVGLAKRNNFHSRHHLVFQPCPEATRAWSAGISQCAAAKANPVGKEISSKLVRYASAFSFLASNAVISFLSE